MNSFDIRIPYVEVRDKNRDIIGIVEGAEIFFEYNLNGCGEFEVYCRATQNNLSLLQKDNYITLPVNADTTENQIEENCNIWIIEKIQRDNSRTGGRWITATGREAKQIVDRRIIKTTALLSKGANLVNEIKTKLFDKNLTMADETDPRKIKGFVFNSSSVDSVVEDDTQVTYNNLFDYTEEVYLKYGIGAKLRFNRNTKEMLYTIYKGENKANLIVFSRGNANLLSTTYNEDWTTYKNNALVGGEEKEEERYEINPITGETIRVYKVTKRTNVTIDDGSTDIDRREVFVDARDLQSSYEEEVGSITITHEYDIETEYKPMLRSRGYENLSAENNLKIEFAGEIDVTNNNYRFNFAYYLGDIVKIRDDDFGTEILVRISKFIKVQNDEGYKEYFEYEKYEEVI